MVLEANLDVGRGPVASILVQRGTLSVGDPLVAGAAWGRVRALIDDHGHNVRAAGPSTPVQVLGLNEVADAGDQFVVAPDEKLARSAAQTREHWQRVASLGREAAVTSGGAKLEDIFEQIQQGEAATLNLVLKADVNGSLEALTEALRKLERDDVKLSFVQRGVGGITKSDVQLAAASNASIIGFNVRPDRTSRELAMAEDVEIRTYEIIYQVLEDIENALLGLLAPEYEEVVTGEAEVREIFSVPAGRQDRRLLRHQRRHHPELEGALPARGHDHLEGHDQLAQAVQGRRPRGAVRLRVRHRAVRLPGPQAGRRHRDVRRARDPAHLTACGGRASCPTRRTLMACMRRLSVSSSTCRECRSLKAKRALIRPVIEGLARRHRVSVSEVGHHDAWHLATVGVAAVAPSQAHLGDLLDDVERFVWSFPEVEVLRIDRLWIEEEETS